ncbi:GGDEF domain-containing protein [Actinoplanes aureus]|uniref:GGDEF domain-containing protein n=1 Tax=Actinoplanes aureus TaxID=2792083 RepID=A0A931CC16_9ACTN|nr:GGDEF domain-containing protein [Actinoplanes aureus]MBG0563831.1 GGDEF domain-containing protein [Actinoplanes aureus]
MRETTRQAVRLLEQAQTGDASTALAEAEAKLREATGDIADGPACMHFVRAVAFLAGGDPRKAIAAAELTLHAAAREDSGGWQAAALGTRAWQRLRLGEADAAEHDLDGVLRDLVTAEALVAGEPDPVAAVNARVAIAIGYYELRLYELVEPQFRTAYEMSSTDAEQNGNRAMWLLNLAEIHLRWALELYQVGQVAEAESHTAGAEAYARRAAAEVDGADADTWRDNALLFEACSRADRHDPASAAVDIAYYTERLEKRGFTGPALTLSRPFQGVALSRSGHIEEALRVMEAAVAALPPDGEWLIAASTYRTQAVLMANQGSREAKATLAYGDTLAAALWRQRLNTLHAARTVHDLEALRQQHEQMARAVELDPLTGVANRRAFDRALAEAATGSQRIAVLIIDTDGFKQINDTYGHAAGDSALRAIAAALAAQVDGRGLLARLGGDEFAVLLDDTCAAEAAAVAVRMVHAVRDIPDCPATLSIGVADGLATALPDAVARADEAMYEIKRAGGDGVRVSEPGTTAMAA